MISKSVERLLPSCENWLSEKDKVGDSRKILEMTYPYKTYIHGGGGRGGQFIYDLFSNTDKALFKFLNKIEENKILCLFPRLRPAVEQASNF